jgi:hypothetical protein
MAKFVYAYQGGTMAETAEQQQAAMEAWMGWFGELGPAVLDGGNPFGASATVRSDGAGGEASSVLTGYSIVEADDLATATALAKGCPVLAHGGSVDVYEALPM